MKQQIIVITGATGSGKSKLALSLCRKCNGAIISADSRQVYRGMDIGTGKEQQGDDYKIQKLPDRWVVNGVDLYGYDLVNPNEPFSVALYVEKFYTEFLPKIVKQGKLPFLVGGTGFYIKAVLDGIETIAVPPNLKLREELHDIQTQQGVKALLPILDAVDPERVKQIDHQNPHRIIRAIEIASFSGPKKKPAIHRYVTLKPLVFGIQWEREKLYKRIDERIDQMINTGLIPEISHLLQRGYTWDLPAMHGIGYRQLKPFFDEKALLTDCVTRFKFDSHAYARRQLTWFRKEKRIKWITKDYTKQLDDLIVRV